MKNLFSARILLPLLCLAATPALALVTNVWISTSGGNWSDPANWENGEIPNGTNCVAEITQPAHNATITVNQELTLAGLILSNTGRTINLTPASGYGTIVLNGGEAGAFLITACRSNVINTGSITWQLESDLFLELRVPNGYNRLGTFTGDFDIHLNRDLGGNGVVYATSQLRNFTGDWHIYGGYVMTTSQYSLGSTGTENVIHFYNNAGLRCNGGTFGDNRRYIVHESGGMFAMNSYRLTLNAENQISGSGVLRIDDPAPGRHSTVVVNNSNDAFTGILQLGVRPDRIPEIIFGADGSLAKASAIYLIGTNSLFTCDAKEGGYAIPAGQTLCGSGMVRGTLVVDGGAVRPGVCPDIPAILTAAPLTVTNGISFAQSGTYICDLDLTGQTLISDDSSCSKLVLTGGVADLAGGKLRLEGLPAENTETELPDNGEWVILEAQNGTISGKLQLENPLFNGGSFYLRNTGSELILRYSSTLLTTLLSVR